MTMQLEHIVTKLRERHADAGLTPREHEILRLICQGMMTKQIAAQLGTSEHTVQNQRRDIVAKVGAKGLAHLGWLANERGLV